MSGLLDELLGAQNEVIENVKPLAGNDPRRAEQAFNAAVASLLRGMEQKAETSQGAENLWDLLKRQVEQGNIPKQAPSSGSDIQVRDLDAQNVKDIMSQIFGEQAPQVEGGFGKVITLDPETSRNIFAKVLPVLLSAIFGAAEKAPAESRQALPEIITGARKEAEQRQPKLGGVLAAIFDKDHDGDVDLNDLVGIFAGR